MHSAFLPTENFPAAVERNYIRALSQHCVLDTGIISYMQDELKLGSHILDNSKNCACTVCSVIKALKI
jgi:hypothetical protein